MEGLSALGLHLNRVNPLGVCLMALALALLLLSGRLCEKTGITRAVFQLIALFICAGGALLAII